MESAWNRISGHVDWFFHNRRLNRFFKTAEILKPRIESFLQEKGIKYSIKILDDSEGIWWTKVKIDVQVNIENYDEILKLWAEIDDVVYKGLPNEDILNVYISVDQQEKCDGSCSHWDLLDCPSNCPKTGCFKWQFYRTIVKEETK